MLQIFSLTVFGKMPILQALAQLPPTSESTDPQITNVTGVLNRTVVGCEL